MIVLFDGDVLVYRAAWSIEKRIGQGEEALASDLITEYLADLIDLVCVKCDAYDYVVYLSEEGGKSHRQAHLTTIKYKENRKGSAKPVYYRTARNVLIGFFGAEVADNLEADDLLGIYQCDETIIASVDKDLLMIPGLHYNLRTRKRSKVKEGLGSLSYKKGKLTGGGFKWFCAQMLTGDTVDNIPGIKGIGGAKAFKLLSKKKTIKGAWDAVVATYKEKGVIDTLHEHGMMLWILREHDEYYTHWLEEHYDDK